MKDSQIQTDGQCASSLERLVRRWWVVECRKQGDMHEIGGNHATLEKARWYLEHCLAKDKRRKYCVIVRHEQTATVEAPNDPDQRPGGKQPETL